MRRLIAVLMLGTILCAPAAAAPTSARELYVAERRTCAGFPRARIEMARGYCAGLVVYPKSHAFADRMLKFPRTLMPFGDDGTVWLVTDLGGWVPDRGAVWRLTARPGAEPKLVRLISGLSMAHGTAIGPDGRVYVGGMGRIVAFDASAADPQSTLATVVGSLPDNRLHEDRHPLSTFLFDRDWSLLVNVGAPSDQCADAKGDPLGDRRCSQSEGAEPAAVIRRYPYLGQGRWSPDYSIVARGLRNSVALVRHESGLLLQAENSYDFASADEPYETLNRVTPGAHYGWPYCYDMDRPTPVWGPRKAMDCASPARTRPLALIAPHAAPLAMLYYSGVMFPQLRGKLLMSWHGYRSTGSRLVALDTDRSGVPVIRANARFPADQGGRMVWKPYRAGPGVQVTPITIGWREVKGSRPTGAPVGMAVAPDGAIWLCEDRNGTILRIAADRP